MNAVTGGIGGKRDQSPGGGGLRDRVQMLMSAGSRMESQEPWMQLEHQGYSWEEQWGDAK